MIQVTNVHKSYSDREVLKGINFSIDDGEIFGFLGPSGAGKTTLIRILTGQLGFEKGNVTILEKDVKTLNREDRKSIGIMMDEFGVYERLSCYDNLKVFADIYGIPYDKVRQTLSEVGLEQAMKKAASDEKSTADSQSIHAKSQGHLLR